MTRTESKKLNELLSIFNDVTDREERSMLLIGYADRFREVPSSVAHRPFPENHRVPYCESEAYVWLVPNPDGTAQPVFAVENPSGISAKALAAILTDTLSGAPPQVIASVSPEIVTEIFRENISMGKGMGLTGMVEMMRGLARRLSDNGEGSANPSS